MLASYGFSDLLNTLALDHVGKLPVMATTASTNPSTVTVQLLLIPLPSAAVAVIVVTPVPTAITTPFSTVAAASLLLLHMILVSVAFSGFTVAVNVIVYP